MPAPKKKPLSTLAKVTIGMGILLVTLVTLLAVLEYFGISFSRLEYPGINAVAPRTATEEAANDYDMGGDAMATRQKLALGGVASSSIAPTPSTPPVGNDAEDYEVTTYSASIETQNLKDSCGKISALKSRKDIIFQNSDENERACSYTFKVDKGKAGEILELLKSMDPKTLNENVYTIKKILEEYESQESILKKKAEAIETTLADAIKAYDEVAAQARNTRDTESLTKVMNNKIELIQRLSNERIQNNAQLEQLARAKAEQADQLVYSNFYVSITEDTFFNGRDIRESWQEAVKNLVLMVNAIAQGLTLGLVVLVLGIVQYGLYLLILLFVAKYGWRFAKEIWKK